VSPFARDDEHLNHILFCLYNRKPLDNYW